MTPVQTNKSPTTVRGPDTAKRDLHNLEKVRGIFTALSKYIHAKTIYAANNPNVTKFSTAFHQAFRTFFADEKELVLTIEQYRIRWNEEEVYKNDRKNESIAFLLFKDGVGEVIFQSAVTQAELEQFVDLIRNEIYNPSAHLDIVSRLWQSEFTNIAYRVFDECADGVSGDGRGSGSESRERPLLVNDHPDIPMADDKPAGDQGRSDASIEPLATYLYGLVDRVRPNAAAHEKEQHAQEMLSSFFTVSSEELQTWRDEFSTANEGNKLLWLVTTMLDFTQLHSSPSVARDILDIIERIVHYAVEEAHIPTLISLLDIQRHMAANETIAVDFQSLPGRIKDELTRSAFILSLGKIAGRSKNDAHDVLQYFSMIGKDAVPGLCEVLASAEDPSVHKDACDTLIAIAGDEIPRIVNGLHLDNPNEAKDAVYLFRHVNTQEVPPIIKTLMSSPEIQVREHVIDYLAYVGNDEAASLLTRLLEDGDANVRIKTLAAVEQFKHPVIIQKVTSQCFVEDYSARSPDELERMFRTVGKLGGEGTVAQLRLMTKKKSWLGLSKSQSKQNKLLAITALRHIPGGDTLNMLRELANDGDSLVRTKAQYVLKQLEDPKGARGRERTPVEVKEAE